MFSAAHTQILLYQYFKNDSEDPLAFTSRSDQKQDQPKRKENAQTQLNRMIEALNALNFEPKVELLDPPPKDSLRNYSYPQFEVRRARDDGKASLATQALKAAVNK